LKSHLQVSVAERLTGARFTVIAQPGSPALCLLECVGVGVRASS
jgi:hypothetical protein